MIQSTFPTFVSSPPRVTLKRAWSIGSLLACMAALIVSAMTLVFHEAGVSPTVLLTAIATLLIVTIVHARFLFFAQDQSRQRTELLRNKEREFESIFENALDAILVLDEDGVCRNANPSASSFLSTRGDRVVGQPFRSFFANPADFNSIWSRLKEDRANRGEIELVRSDGATVYAEFTAAAHFLPNRHLMILRDVTSRRRAQQAVAQGLMVARSSWQEAETLRKASIALTEDLRMNNVLDALLQTLADFVPYERAQLFLLEADSRLFLAHEAAHPSRPIRETGFPEMFEISDLPILRKVFASLQGIISEDVSKEPDWRPSDAGKHIQSWICVPIVSSKQILGLLSLSDSNPAQFSADHFALARSLSTPAAVAIQNARLYERAEIYGAELERRVAELQQIDQELHGSPNANRKSIERFEKIFRSAPVAMSVSTLVSGDFLEANDAFERSFGIRREDIAAGAMTDFDLWEDRRERTKLIDRLGRSKQVHGAVARFRQRSGRFEETMYSAAMIDIEGQLCLLVAFGNQVEQMM